MAYQAKGVTCRQYTETTYIEGNRQTTHGAACRNPGGSRAIAADRIAEAGLDLALSWRV